MKKIYVQELKSYSKAKILEILENDEDSFNKLIEFSIIDKQDYAYQFNYVGAIIIENLAIYCYPKYIPNKDNIKEDFRQVIRVIKKYKNLHDDLDYQNEEITEISFNLLSMMIFFLEDYYENGLYTNIQNILEVNGNGEINWDRTINYTNPIIKDNKPYYMELYTKYKINDLLDFFRQLHEYIITKCSKKLEKAGLLELFDLTPAELSDKTLDDFGNCEFIKYKLEKELNIEFNSHKRKLLKSMHAFISHENSFSNQNFITLYGTSTYHVIWEEICSFIFSNKLYKPLNELRLSKVLDSKYFSKPNLISVIKKPKWILKEGKTHWASKSFEPDLVTFYNDEFIILDAKYYKLKFDEDELSGNPGLGDITKQYLYQLALEDFRINHGFKSVKNALLFPTYDEEVVNKGKVKIDILSDLGLENIQVIMLPVHEVNQMYLENKKMNIKRLNL